MANYTYQWLCDNPPSRRHTAHKLGYLSPHFLRDKSLDVIASETDIPLAELERWLEKDFPLIEAAVISLEQALAECDEQLAARHERVADRYMTADKLLENGFKYQDVFLGNKISKDLAKELGVDEETLGLHMNSLYGKLYGVVTERGNTLAQLIQGISQQGGGQNG